MRTILRLSFLSLLLFVFGANAAVFIPGNGGGNGNGNSSVSITNSFAQVFGTAAVANTATPHPITFPISGVLTNMSTNSTNIIVQSDGWFLVGANVNYKMTNNDTAFLAVMTNFVEDTRLRSFGDYKGGVTGVAAATNSITTLGIVYALSNTAIGLNFGWHLSAVQQQTELHRSFFVTKVMGPGTGGVGGGSVETQWVPDASQLYTNSSGGFGIKDSALVTNIIAHLRATVAGHLTVNSNLLVSGSTTNGGAVTSTNGPLIFGQNAFPITFGGNQDFVTGDFMTNWYALYQKGDLIFNVSGTGADFNGAGAQARFRTGTLLQMDAGSRLELDYLTANRVMITGAGSMATNSDMRLASSLAGAADGEVLKYHAASGTWTNGTDTGGAGSGDVFGPASVNALSVPVWGSTGGDRLTNTSFFILNNNIFTSSGTPWNFGVNDTTNWTLNISGHLTPIADTIGNIGSASLRVGSNYVKRVFVETIDVGAVNTTAGLAHFAGTNGLSGLKVTVPDGVTGSPTNILKFDLSVLEVGQHLYAHSVSGQTVTMTNGFLHPFDTISGVGGANTNFTVVASPLEPVTYADGGTTNVNIVAFMNWSTTHARRGTVIFTNRTATARQLSFGVITNSVICLQQFNSGIVQPHTITNSQAARIDYELRGSNVQYSVVPMALPAP